MFYLCQAKARETEEETDRYRRICGERYPVRLKNAYHLSNILSGGDIPYACLEWVGLLMGEKDSEAAVKRVKKECGSMLHGLDSFCNFGDLPAHGIARATWFLSAAFAKGENFEKALQNFVSENASALGNEFSRGCFVKNLEVGSILPYGIFQATSSARFLATFYKIEVAVEKLNFFGQKVTQIKEISAMRICVRCGKAADETKQIVHEIFPEMAPKNLGSGPQHYGLFIQETVNVDKVSAESRLPILIERLGLK